MVLLLINLFLIAEDYNLWQKMRQTGSGPKNTRTFPTVLFKGCLKGLNGLEHEM